jgi:hypothetical protein
MTRVRCSGRRSGLPLSPPPAAVAALSLALTLAASSASAQTLRGSAAALDRQNEVARQHDFTYLRTPQQVRTFVSEGHLVPVQANANFDLHQVSFPYARPELAIFIERLASQYRQACGQKLVVTSLTRPISTQPPNASSRSVHPTGMAVDLRIPGDSRCRSWLESVLLQLDGANVLDATRENNPPHYHVVIFPTQYMAYLDQRDARVVITASAEPAEAQGEGDGDGPSATGVATLQYQVRRGDSLWIIAQRTGTTVERLRAENDLSGSRIYAGQILTVPGR